MSAPRTTAERWWYALKPASWPKLLVPTALGQALGVAQTKVVDVAALALGVALSLLLTAAIVLLNDYWDREVDAIKRRMFPRGCSPKTIPDGILPAHQLLFAGGACALLFLAAGFGAGSWLELPGVGPGALGCLGLFVGYSLPPLRLNYRGGGELLEMLGVGVALPWLQLYLQTREVFVEELVVLPGFALLALSSALASGLSDEQSDRRGGKRTFTTLLGNRAVRRLVEGSVVGGVLAWIGAALLFPGPLPLWLLPVPVLAMVPDFRRLRAASDAATTNEFEAQSRYKQHLHHVVWRGTELLGGAVVLRALLLR